MDETNEMNETPVISVSDLCLTFRIFRVSEYVSPHRRWHHVAPEGVLKSISFESDELVLAVCQKRK